MGSTQGFRVPGRGDHPRNRPRLGHLLLAVLLTLILHAPAAGQSLSGSSSEDLEPSPAPWPVIAGEVALGSVLAASLGYGVGLLAENVCSECDASQPGGDAPGLLIGVPSGAVLGVWFVGRFAPPQGKIWDTILGAVAGTAVFAGSASLLEEQSDALRWAGVVFPAALASMGWNRSRAQLRPEMSWDPGEPRHGIPGALEARVAVLRMDF